MTQIVCSACGAANRIPEGRDARAAKCGRCGGAVFPAGPLEVTGAALGAHLKLTRDTGLLLDVWAPWCGPCRAMAPQFAAAAKVLEPGVRLLKLNSQAEPQAAAELGVSGIPALILFANGAVVDRTAGLKSADQIVAWTRQGLARATAS